MIARTGDIIQLFDPKLWSYHLGTSAVGGNSTGSKSSIGIELTNIGPLEVSGNWLWTYVGTQYCRLDEQQWYSSLDQEYRSYRHFASFTNEQYESLNLLLGALVAEFDIPFNFLPSQSRYETFQTSQAARSFEGISSHVNYRPTGKTDIGPAFDWERVGEGKASSKLKPQMF